MTDAKRFAARLIMVSAAILLGFVWAELGWKVAVAVCAFAGLLFGVIGFSVEANEEDKQRHEDKLFMSPDDYRKKWSGE